LIDVFHELGRAVLGHAMKMEIKQEIKKYPEISTKFIDFHSEPFA